jgi:hypothetical protein
MTHKLNVEVLIHQGEAKHKKRLQLGVELSIEENSTHLLWSQREPLLSLALVQKALHFQSDRARARMGTKDIGAREAGAETKEDHQTMSKSPPEQLHHWSRELTRRKHIVHHRKEKHDTMIWHPRGEL